MSVRNQFAPTTPSPPNSSRVFPSESTWNQQLQLPNQVAKNQLLEEKVR
ncbi:hypothetical protein [Floridanema evergladense]|uniref:Uncharacterized protein n=1 Tax=Floridaenema evergladense BLCC-F167 TaxID=3153639 RepID=A0ABV4WM37_9CYAN